MSPPPPVPTPPAEPAREREWLLMVRHTAVCESLKGRCYGNSDVDLSADGEAALPLLAARLAALAPTLVFHSGLTRTRRLADSIANRLARKARADARLREFDFGDWELKTWDEIHASGQDIARLIHEPDTFAPPGGETVHAMRDRVLDWYRALPGGHRILVVGHGGPISVLQGSLEGLPAASWPRLVPDYGGEVRLPLMACLA